MKAYQVISQRVTDIGISKAELSRRIGINDELLRRSLAGKRKIPADEFLLLCQELDLKLSDFNIKHRRRYRKTFE